MNIDSTYENIAIGLWRIIHIDGHTKLGFRNHKKNKPKCYNVNGTISIGNW